MTRPALAYTNPEPIQASPAARGSGQDAPAAVLQAGAERPRWLRQRAMTSLVLLGHAAFCEVFVAYEWTERHLP